LKCRLGASHNESEPKTKSGVLPLHALDQGISTVKKQLHVANTIQISITDREGLEQVLEAPTDMNMSLMEFCKAVELPVEGTCGGMALCASCHVYVTSNHVLHEPSDDELNMLDSAFFVKPNSRLGCQIRLAEDLDGLAVTLAPQGL
jgi:ferredoxin-2, mitochondrial